MRWRTARLCGPAEEIHHRPICWAERSVTFCEPVRPALVLGSTQPVGDVDAGAAATAGVDVVRRRSGGGAVLLEDRRVVWADVVVPAGDPLWQVDVGRASWWLGEVWAGAVASLGFDGFGVHRGPLVTSRWSRMVCFAGVGPGEVCAPAGGGKTVGISQRRVRQGALFQCAVVLGWRASALSGLLALDAAAGAALEQEVAGLVRPLSGCTPAQVEQAFLAHLPGGAVDSLTVGG